jgi:hypothetical protein
VRPLCEGAEKNFDFPGFSLDVSSRANIVEYMILENIAKAIEKSGRSRAKISRDTGIDEAVLCRIVTGSGTGSCSVQTLEVLCKYLGLELVQKKRKKKAR